MFFNRDDSLVYYDNTTVTSDGVSKVVQMNEAVNYVNFSGPGKDLVTKATVTANDAASGDETYKLYFKSGAGAPATISPSQARTHMEVEIPRGTTGPMFFSLKQNQTLLKYTWFELDVGGTSPSITLTTELTTRDRNVGRFDGPDRAGVV